MSKYIDADALMNSLCQVAKSLSDDGAPAAAGSVAGMVIYISSFPAVDVEPVKREPCDCCRLGIKVVAYQHPTTHEYGGTWWTETNRTPEYCPFCGRKLEDK